MLGWAMSLQKPDLSSCQPNEQMGRTNRHTHLTLFLCVSRTTFRAQWSTVPPIHPIHLSNLFIHMSIPIHLSVPSICPSHHLSFPTTCPSPSTCPFHPPVRSHPPLFIPSTCSSPSTFHPHPPDHPCPLGHLIHLAILTHLAIFVHLFIPIQLVLVPTHQTA